MQAVILEVGAEVFNPSTSANFLVKENTFLVAWQIETDLADLAYIMACPVPFTSLEMAEQILDGINNFLAAKDAVEARFGEKGDDHEGN